MWVVSGPFDGVQEGSELLLPYHPVASGLTLNEEEKLLKPGHTYSVGRAKAGQSLVGRLNIDNKAISHEHIDLIVGSYEIDDVVRRNI